MKTVAAIALAAALLPALPARAQSYPSQPVRFVLSVPPGGSVDSLGRVVAKYLSPNLGQPVIIENKPGGSNRIATDFAARSAPDGHTLLMLGSSQAQVEAAAISTGQPRPFDTLRDFTSVGTLATNTDALVVHPSLPVKTAADFVAFARSKPGYITYGSTGVAKSDHIAAALFEQMTGARMLHVPFKGLGDAIPQLIAGRILTLFSALPPMAAHIRSGKLRLIGVVSAERSFLFPDAPTLAEALPLPGDAVETWIGMMAPAKTPAPVVSRLNGEIRKMLQDEAFVKQSLHPLGLSPWGHTPEEMTRFVQGELATYTKLFKDIGLKLE
ncbi:MAG: tripartite tricarboxylate transporter substrate binding protein [Burkholderiales bacterium]|nr:tripartite tricarboxylate transporter substrate binding protein [Burkholderiales bacterium]